MSMAMVKAAFVAEIWNSEPFMGLRLVMLVPGIPSRRLYMYSLLVKSQVAPFLPKPGTSGHSGYWASN